MKQDDLTEVKYIGINRMRLLNDLGITSIKQLRDMPLTKLAAIKSIGEHYAILIKNAVSEYDRSKQDKMPDKTAENKKRKIKQLNKELKKRIKKLSKNLNRVDGNLKPLMQKQQLDLYIDFKKKYKKLKARLGVLGRIKKDLPRKDKKLIIKKAETLLISLKGVGKKPQKKECERAIQKIQSFSRVLRDIIS